MFGALSAFHRQLSWGPFRDGFDERQRAIMDVVRTTIGERYDDIVGTGRPLPADAALDERRILDYMAHGALDRHGELGEMSQDVDWPYADWRLLVGFVPVTAALLDRLTAFIGVRDLALSVGAGGACVESLLVARGCRVVAVDAAPESAPFTHMRVLRASVPLSRDESGGGDVAAARAAMAEAQTLLLLWPTTAGYDDAALDEFCGDQLAVVAETRDRRRGDVGSEQLWRRVMMTTDADDVDAEWNVVGELALPFNRDFDWFPCLYLCRRNVSMPALEPAP